MGFRNPITSAGAVDTRPGVGAAGVKVAGASTTWYDGYGGSATALLTTPPGGGSGGDSFTLSGPKRFTGNSAAVVLGEEGIPAGGYRTAARILGDVLSVPAALDLPAVTLTPTANYKATGTSTGGTPGGDQLGDLIVLRGALTNAVPYTGAAGTTYQVGSIPAALAPATSRYFIVALATGTAFSYATLIVAPGGAISYIPAAAVSAGFLLSLGGANWRVGT
jgi:hypothetical protein